MIVKVVKSFDQRDSTDFAMVFSPDLPIRAGSGLRLLGFDQEISDLVQVSQGKEAIYLHSVLL